MAPLLSSVAATLHGLLRAFLLWVLSAGPIPTHIAIIMDGNRRFADRLRMDRRTGHSHGYEALMRTLKDCFDLRVKIVTLYAFSIENFQRPRDEVSALMDLMQTKLETLIEKEDLVREYGIRVRVLGDLSLLPDCVRKTAERAMAVTSQNSSAVLNLCVSYTSTHEIVQSVQKIRDDLVSVLGRHGDVDGSQKTLDSGSVGKGDLKENDGFMITCNGRVVGSQMIWEDGLGSDDYGHAYQDVGNGHYGHANGFHQSWHDDEGNGDYGHSYGSHKARVDGVGNGDCVHVNGYCSTLDGGVGNGGVGNGDCGNANRSDKAWGDDVKSGDYNCEDGSYLARDDRVSNGEYEMRSQKIGLIAEKIVCTDLTSFESSDWPSNVLRNRVFKKAGLLGNCDSEKSEFMINHDRELIGFKNSGDDSKICDCKDYGYLGKCVESSKKAFKNCDCMATGCLGDVDCEVVGDSMASGFKKAWDGMDYYSCKTNGSKTPLNGLGIYDAFNPPSKLPGLQKRWCESKDSCPHFVASIYGILEKGLPNSCNCGQHCYVDDRILKLVKDRVSEEEIEKHLYTESCPPPDILIRTSGETRLSNFLLWQASFSHLAFYKVLWPEFSFRHLFFVVLEYQRAYPSILKKQRCGSKAS